MSWIHLDQQMANHSESLLADVGITKDQSKKLATAIASDIRFLSQETKHLISTASPVSLKDRLTELRGFQGWMDIAQTIQNPFVTRAQVITQNYICFVYLPEGCFSVVRKYAPIGSVAKKCAKFLTDNPIRAFRNAVSHSNWKYREDFSGLIYWARIGDDKNEPMTKFEVDGQKLAFWQSLSRCVAYSIYESLN